MLDEFLRRSGRELVFIDCVRGNRWAVPLAQAHGFERSRSLTRMVRGPSDFRGGRNWCTRSSARSSDEATMTMTVGHVLVKLEASTAVADSVSSSRSNS